MFFSLYLFIFLVSFISLAGNSRIIEFTNAYNKWRRKKWTKNGWNDEDKRNEENRFAFYVKRFNEHFFIHSSSFPTFFFCVVINMLWSVVGLHSNHRYECDGKKKRECVCVPIELCSVYHHFVLLMFFFFLSGLFSLGVCW